MRHISLLEDAASFTGRTLQNDSMDVAIKGCFVGFDTVACVRRSTLSALMVVTFVLCLVKVGRFHTVHHEQVHHYVIFYMALVECIICIVNWMLSGHYPELDLAATALKVLQLVTLCHYHWVQAWRILHYESVAKKIWFPLMGIFSTYVIAVASIGILDVDPSWTECFKPYWVMLSAADFLGVQLFLLAGVYITKKIDAVSTLECVKKTQKRNLWSIIFAFEVSALVSLSYDLTVKFMGDENLGCSGLFAHTQIIYSPIFFLFMVFKFCLPIWSLLAVLEALPAGISYSEILAASHSGNMSGACVTHSVNAPYRILRNYVFDDNSEFLSHSAGSTHSRSSSGMSGSSDVPEFSTRHLFSGRVIPTLYIPGHGHVIQPAPRPTSQEWMNPRDYWRSRQRFNSSPGGGLTASPRNANLASISEETSAAPVESGKKMETLNVVSLTSDQTDSADSGSDRMAALVQVHRENNEITS